MAERQAGLREVVLVSLAAVGVVLGAAVVTALLPPDLQSVVFRSPLVIGVLVVGTIVALWLVAARR
jgi:FtsH-binding integral membrane protein